MRGQVADQIGVNDSLREPPPAIGLLAQSAGLLNSMWLIVALFVAAFAAAGSFRPRPAAPFPEES